MSPGAKLAHRVGAFIYLFIYLSIYLFVYLYNEGPMHLSRRIFEWAKRLTLSWQLKVCLSVCLLESRYRKQLVSKTTENYKGLGTSIQGLECNRPLHLPSWCFRFCVIFISFGRVHFYFPRFQSRFCPFLACLRCRTLPVYMYRKSAFVSMSFVVLYFSVYFVCNYRKVPLLDFLYS